MARTNYLIKRAGAMVVSIFAMITVLFILFRLLPGDPAQVYIEPAMSDATKELIRDRYGVNDPLHVQYVKYMSSLLTGSLGTSFYLQKPVISVLANRLPNTLILMLPSVILAFFIGPIVGAYLGWVRGTLKDTVGVAGVIFFYAAPIFWTGMLGIMLFSFQLEWLPSGGMHSPSYQGTNTIPARYFNIDFLIHLVLPLTLTTLYFLTSPAFFMRNTIIEVLGSDFIELNRAQGLSKFSILYRHAARNSMLPVLHFGAVTIGYAFGGSIIVETVFSWPGVGRLMWTAVQTRDYPLAQGIFILMASMIIFANFAVDALSVYIDPRVSEEEVTG